MAYEREFRMPSAVGGWLLFFCIVLTFVIPITTVYSTVMALRSGLDVFGLVYEFALLALAGFSFAAGVSLWLVLPNAVAIARLFLIARAVFALLVFGRLLFVTRGSSDLDPNLILDILVRPLLFAAVWHSYLARSKRVQETYPQDYSVVTKRP